ncbi:MAG TPA: lysylphosphatidylglycerol synthase transmembrane domain-containing protein [Candidatus Cybelea sp.]|nr:lysylphosphatidylglycerol synthase transmembrane domain-containing protein [Candidatus Cybelea sp.]
MTYPLEKHAMPVENSSHDPRRMCREAVIPPPRQRNWSRAGLRALVHYGGSALALFLLFRFLSGRQVLAALAKLPPRLWILATLTYLLIHCLGIAKWRLSVNAAGAGLSYLHAARCYFAGLFGSLFLPSLIGGDLVRATLAMRYGRTKAGVLLGSLFDRMVDLAALVLLSATGAVLVPGTLQPQSRRILLWVGAVALAGVALLITVAAVTPVRRLSMAMRRRLVSLRHASRSLARRPRVVLATLSIAIVAQLSFIRLSILLAVACGLRLGFLAWLFAWPLAKLSAAIPATQGGIGVREAALAGLLVPFGAPPTLTVAAGLAWEGVVIAGALAGGLFALFARPEDAAFRHGRFRSR